MKRAWLVALSAAVVLPAAAQDFATGFDAFKRGDYGLAIEHWKPLAEDDDQRAQIGLARIYVDHPRDAADIADGLSLYERAARAGSTTAMLDLGDLYLAGSVVAKDFTRARMWYEIAQTHDSALGGERTAALDTQLTPEEIAAAERLARNWLTAAPDRAAE